MIKIGYKANIMQNAEDIFKQQCHFISMHLWKEQRF